MHLLILGNLPILDDFPLHVHVSRAECRTKKVVRMGARRDVYRVLVGKPEGKRPLGRPRCRCDDNIMMDLQEVGCWGMDWIDLAQDRDRWQALLNAEMNLRIP